MSTTDERNAAAEKNAADIRKRCEDAIARSGSAAEIQLLISGKWPSRGCHKRLFGQRGGPQGKCVSELEDGVLCAFKAKAVLAVLTRTAPQPKQ